MGRIRFAALRPAAGFRSWSISKCVSGIWHRPGLEWPGPGCCRIRCRTHWKGVQRSPASGYWSLEGEWGLALNDGPTGIPYMDLSSSGTGSGLDLTLGWSLLSVPGGPHTELDIKALRRRDGAGKINHGIGAQWRLRW